MSRILTVSKGIYWQILMSGAKSKKSEGKRKGERNSRCGAVSANTAGICAVSEDLCLDTDINHKELSESAEMVNV